MKQNIVRWSVLCAALLVLLGGCSRGRYRLRADRDSQQILTEKSAGTPWQPPSQFTIDPHPWSRFFDPTPPTDPLLPSPSPRLYAYRLPELPQRDPRRFRPGDAQPLPRPPRYEEVPRVPSAPAPDPVAIRLAGHRQPLQPPAPPSRQPELPLIEPGDDGQLRIASLPAEAWDTIPASCLRRMFEFDSIDEEFRRSFNVPPSDQQRDTSQRLNLEDIVDLALINSREYQAQKEALYRAALRLSLERYAYQLKFTSSGNGTDVNYTHRHSTSGTQNTLALPSTVTTDKVLGTGGDLLARFANDIVFTYNGPNGFAADVGWSLVFDLSQAVIQRDIVFESLTQTERNVVYAARDFARFRKEFFRDLANDYYNLLLSYREIEIAAQNYFGNYRGFDQGEAEYRAGQLPRFQVDQFEQRMLSSRSTLIGQCNALERSLDLLKIRIGLPTEMPLNMDLAELYELTRRDQLQVSSERVRRTRRSLLSERNLESPDQGVLINGGIDLARRLDEVVQLRGQSGQSESAQFQLERRLAQLLVQETRLVVGFNRQTLEIEKQTVPAPPPVRIFQRSLELVSSLLELADRNLALAELSSGQTEAIGQARRQLEQLQLRFDQVSAGLSEAVRTQQLDRIPELVRDAEMLLTDADALADQTRQIAGLPELTAEQQAVQTVAEIDELLTISQQLLQQLSSGLAPIDIPADDAMITALVSRLDLMNVRGELADQWRRIKLAGDDLKSVLNLNVSQTLDSQKQRPSQASFDQSTTRLSVNFDAPLNRRAQRNNFRTSLINYNAALRSLIAFEDSIKLSVRDDLRQLQLDQEQYRIAVASAALAYERVISTPIQLQLNFGNVTARDVLEAQQDYTSSLNGVARAHIRYILDRIDLFLDLELLEVDETGFWDQLYDEEVQPIARFQLPGYARPAYGTLPAGVKYSPDVRRMLQVPTGDAVIIDDRPAAELIEPPTPR